MTHTLLALKEQIQLLSANQAIERLDKYIAAHPDDPDGFILRGMRHFGAGHRALAINDYLEALRIDPGNSGARQALEHANSILDFYNKDLFNP